MKKILFILPFFWAPVKAQIPQAVGGNIVRIENFSSKYVTPRNIDIWLPVDYNGKKKYNVLYMHDGQMLFDSTTTWNRQAWDVDDVLAGLIKEKKVKETIIVGIWNDGANRHPDYFPQKPFESLLQAEKDTITSHLQKAKRIQGVFKPQSDNYLRFIVEELRPYINQQYRVHTGQKNTFIAGSSMGGLISIYALCEYPGVFGGAACFSTHWPGIFTLTNNPFPDAMLRYLQNKLPRAAKHKIYFDCGDKTLDSLYPAIQKRVEGIMLQKGFGQKNTLTRYFPGENHSEKAWHKRLPVALVFLLGKQ